jgi:hypothetical protein
MPGRGRPRLGDEKLTDAERKERWDQRQRNDDGANAKEPQRKPVTIYLREEALQALRTARADSKYLGRNSLRDSRYVEDLLLKRSKRSARANADAKLIDELRAALSHYQVELVHMATIVKARLLKVRADKRLRSKIIDELRQPPSREAFAEECKRRNALVDERHLDRLATDLLPLLKDPATADYHGKIRRRLETYIERLFGLN